MKSLLLSSLLAATTLLVMAQPPDLTETPDKSTGQNMDTTFAEGTHTTARERRGLPADSTKQASSATRKTSVKTKHTHTEAHKTQKRTSASSK